MSTQWRFLVENYLCVGVWQDNLERVIRNTLLVALACITFGCQFYRNVIMDEDGQFFPWHANRDNPDYQKKWNEEEAEWEIKDAERRYETGMIDRYQYNQIRKRHGLQPIL